MGTGINAKGARSSLAVSIILWGSAWGVFEATLGCLLHLTEVNIGWLLWYPVACFFMAGIYRATGRASSVLYIGLLSAAIKLLNLFLPIRADKVINPAMSILFEALAMFLCICVLRKLADTFKGKIHIKALISLGMNTVWRLLYVLYLLFLVPKWILELSILKSSQELLQFLVIYNLATTAIIFLAYALSGTILKCFRKFVPGHNNACASAKKYWKNGKIRLAAASFLFCANIMLEIFL